MSKAETAVALSPQNMKVVEYKAGTEQVKLTVKMVNDYLAKPTASGKMPSEVDITKFIMLCKAQHLNPWLGDAWLLGYDGKDGPEFNLITAHASLLKRADEEPQYKGLTSGTIVKTKDGEIVEQEGKFRTDDQILLGAWAEIKREDRSFGRKKIRLQAFNKGYSRWKTDPEGMIVKCAEAAALREAFPNILSGSYIREEMMQAIDVTDQVEVARPHVVPTPALTEGAPVAKPKPEKKKETKKKKAAKQEKPKEEPPPEDEPSPDPEAEEPAPSPEPEPEPQDPPEGDEPEGGPLAAPKRGEKSMLDLPE